MNVNDPADNREFLVFPTDRITGAKLANTDFKGYYILYPIDRNWFYENEGETMYLGRIHAPSNTIYFKVPKWDNWQMLHDENWRADMERQLKKRVDPNAMTEMDDPKHKARASMDEHPDTKFKHFILRFPQGHEFAAHVLEKESEESDVDLPLARLNVPAYNKTEKTCYAVWKVARVDEIAKKKGRYTKKTARSKNAALFESSSEDEAAEAKDEDERMSNN